MFVIRQSAVIPIRLCRNPFFRPDALFRQKLVYLGMVQGRLPRICRDKAISIEAVFAGLASAMRDGPEDRRRVHGRASFAPENVRVSNEVALSNDL